MFRCLLVTFVYSVFRDRETYHNFNTDFTNVINWLQDKYTDDVELKANIQGMQSKYQHLPQDVFTKEFRKATSKTSKHNEVKKMLKETFSTDSCVTAECEVDTSSEEACVKTYKTLDLLIKSDKRNMLSNSAKQGRVLKHLKASMKKKGSFIKCLQEKEITVSLSHCNFLIAFHDLTNTHPDIIQCSLELRFFIKNLKIIKDVASEVFAR